MTERKDCVFCGLLTGRLRSSVVFNDARLMGVMALRPTHVGHVLLFPAEHVEDFSPRWTSVPGERQEETVV